jgi:hypothetical protein
MGTYLVLPFVRRGSGRSVLVLPPSFYYTEGSMRTVPMLPKVRILNLFIDILLFSFYDSKQLNSDLALTKSSSNYGNFRELMVGANQCESNCEWTSEPPNRTFFISSRLWRVVSSL